MIHCNKAGKSFPVDGTAVAAIDAVTLKIAAGEYVAVTGASGSGKSTLLSLMAGLDRPTAGTISLDGVLLNELDESALAALRRDRLGFVFQSFHLVPSLTLLENVVLPGAFRSGRMDLERAAMLLEKVGLAHRRDFLPGRVSGGELQRAAIARALMNDPAVVFADEPTGNLDSANGHAVLDLLEASTVKNGRTLVLVTHDPLIAKRAGRVIRLEDGRVTEDTGAAPAAG